MCEGTVTESKVIDMASFTRPGEFSFCSRCGHTETCRIGEHDFVCMACQGGRSKKEVDWENWMGANMALRRATMAFNRAVPGANEMIREMKRDE